MTRKNVYGSCSTHIWWDTKWTLATSRQQIWFPRPSACSAHHHLSRCTSGVYFFQNKLVFPRFMNVHALQMLSCAENPINDVRMCCSSPWSIKENYRKGCSNGSSSHPKIFLKENNNMCITSFSYRKLTPHRLNVQRWQEVCGSLKLQGLFGKSTCYTTENLYFWDWASYSGSNTAKENMWHHRKLMVVPFNSEYLY